MKTLKVVTKIKVLFLAFALISAFPAATMLGKPWVKNPLMKNETTVLRTLLGEQGDGCSEKVCAAEEQTPLSVRSNDSKTRRARAR